MSSLFGDTDIVTNTDSAFDHVQSLLVRVRHLIGMVDTGRSLFDEDDVLVELLEAHRTLTIMRVMSERYVIAVAGPQGAGKTTTMHWLYDIPEAYLPMNAITGERLPVLLIESDAEDYQGYIYSYNEATSRLNRSPAEPERMQENYGRSGFE